jgi:hypothetical protein
MNKSAIWVMFVFVFSLAVAAPLSAAPNAAPDEKTTSKADEDPIVYVKEGGKKYHKKNCAVVKTGKTGIKLSEALKKGYEPCKICNPPVVSQKVFVNPSGKVYHKKGCKMIKKEAKEVDVAAAVKDGLTPCKICMPPPKKKDE